MTLQFLLDEHISPRLVKALQRARPKLRARALRDWQGGLYLGVDDLIVLAGAYEERLTLVTFDQRTIVPLLRHLAETGSQHAGVVLVDERTIPPNETGNLTRSLYKLWDTTNRDDWTSRVIYLTR